MIRNLHEQFKFSKLIFFNMNFFQMNKYFFYKKITNYINALEIT